MTRSVIHLLFTLSLIVPAFSQTFGEIGGEVKAATGASYPGRHGDRAQRATPPARHVLGESAQRSGIELQVQQTARIDFSLDVGQLNEVMDVKANAAMLSTEDATVGTVIENRRIVELPLNGRVFTRSPAWLAPTSAQPHRRLRPA